MNILGLIMNRHNTGAALIYGDSVVAISEERLDRKKHSFAFPIKSVEYCLKTADINFNNIDYLAVEQIEFPSKSSSKSKDSTHRIISALKQYQLWPKDETKVIFVNHHDAHAASAYFCSPFDDAAVMAVDHAGGNFRLENGLLTCGTEAFYRGKNNQLHFIRRHHTVRDKDGRRSVEASGVGNFYSEITRFLGFEKLQDGKTMGLAPYGKGVLVDSIPQEQFIKKTSEGAYLFPVPLDKKHPEYDWRYLFKKNRYSRLSGWKRFSPGSLWQNLVYNYLAKEGPFEKEPVFKHRPSIFTEYESRSKNISLPDDFYTEVAYWGQHWLERVMVDYALDLYNITGSKNLCIAGGVGLNSVANKKILDETPFENIFIQPAAGDEGLPLGAALWAKHQVCKKPINWRMNTAYLGREYTNKEVENALQGENYEKIEEPAKIAAKLMAEEKIIGWFQGASEYGPRALGNRSILCSPIPENMKDKLNKQVKHRECFRPFAPAVLEEKVSEYFDIQCKSPFMLLVARALKNNIPATIHVDGTGRVQTVSHEQNPLYYSLIKEFEKKTGVPVVLNTSFNDSGEPIVESPADAVKSFHRTNLDALIIHNFLVRRRNK